MSYEGYSDADFAEEDRPQPFRVSKRYRKYNRKHRKAQAQRLQEYRKYNQKRRRERGTRTQRTK
jgi:hypothetical protein